MKPRRQLFVAPIPNCYYRGKGRSDYQRYIVGSRAPAPSPSFFKRLVVALLECF